MPYVLTKSTTAALVALAGVLVPSGAFAQATNVDAGALAKQAEVDAVLQRAQIRKRPGKLLSLPPITASGVAPGGPTIPVNGWRLEGNRIFPSAVLQKALAPYTGRALTFAQISDAAAAVEAFYDQQGYLVRTLIPAQEVTNGVILLQVVEAKFAGLRYDTTPQRVKPEQISRIFYRKTPVGEPVQPLKFDLPLLLANDLTGVSVTGAFAPGKNPGETVLVLNTQDAAPYTFQVSADNHGSRSTGAYRLNLQARALSPLRLGDDLTFALTKSEGSLNGSLRYSVPLNADGLQANFEFRALRYKVITSEFAALDAKGNSQTARIGLSYPLRRSRDMTINLVAFHERAWFENDANGATVSDYDVQQTSLGVNGYWFDDLWGGGASSFGFSVATGTTKGDRGGAFSDNFTVARMNVSRLQTVNETLSLYGSLSAQSGPRGLDSSEEFTLGGPTGVRAYPRGEASGPSGAVLSLEARWKLATDWQVAAFYDHGRVARRSDAGEPSAYSLDGAGVKVSWTGPAGLSAELIWARRLGSNPNAISDSSRPASVQGRDQDGTLDRNRMWFALSKRF